MNDETFEHSLRFERGEVTGEVRLGKLEAMYEELYAEVIDDGVITQEERNQLDKMADNLGLDRERLRRLEQALQAAYEARNRIVIKDLSMDDAPPPATIMPLEPATDHRSMALERRIKTLEKAHQGTSRSSWRMRARTSSVEVDFSEHAASLISPPQAIPDEDPAELARRVRHDPRDDGSLHALYRLYKKAGDLDRQWCVTQVLSYLGVADAEEQEVYRQHREAALIRPTGSVTQEAWRRLVSHPEEEPLIGEIFAVVVSAVLIGRMSALRRDKQLIKLDPAKKQDPEKTTIQAVRCFHWAAQILGMVSPPLHADPDYPGFVEMVPGVPPASRIGAIALSGRSAAELAFLAGPPSRLLPRGALREDAGCRRLAASKTSSSPRYPSANPGLPLSAQVKQLVVPIANAIEPILEPAAIDRLRGHFLRFVEEGGRTNLQRWTTSVDRSCARAGLLLANDLKAAHSIFALEDPTHLAEKMDDLMSFVVSDRYAKLRRQIGIAVAPPAS